MPTNNPIRAGLIGAGYISAYHLAALRRLPGVRLVGVCDLDASRAAALAARANAPAFSSPAALRDAGADVLHILTPPHTHASLCIEALELGCHVLVEKPLAEDVEDCLRIARAAERANRRVCVGHSLLFDPQVRRALEVVRCGKLGRIASVDILRSSVYPPYPGGPLPPNYRCAGYPFRDLGVHELYLIEAVLGPIEDVQGQWSSLGGDPNLAFDEWRAHVRCRDGLGQFQLSWNIRPIQHQIIIQGTRGVLRVDLFLKFQSRRTATRLPQAAERVLNAMTDSLKPLADVARGIYGVARGKVLAYHGLQELVAAFYESLAAGGEPPVGINDATRIVRWTERVARAAEAEHAARIVHLPVGDEVPVLVTGASGALGCQIVRRVRESGQRVRLFVRRMPDVIAEGTEVVVGNLGDAEAVDRAVRGARIVIHAGAAMKGGWIEHECATIVGTRNVIDACRKHLVRKLVHISSLSVLDWAGQPDRPIDESSPLEPHGAYRGHYTRAKLEAETLVAESCREHGLPTVILRPGQIFGGALPLLTPAVARHILRRRVVLGSGNAPLPLVYIDDAVDAILAAAVSPLRDGEIIHLVDDVTPTQNQVLAAAVGKSAFILHVPRWLLLVGGKISELFFAAAGRQSPVSAHRLRSALARRTFQSSRARELLGWQPRVGVRAGMRRVLGPADRDASVPDIPEPFAEANPIVQ